MTKSELIEVICQKYPHLYLKDVERVIATVFQHIISVLDAGHRVELRGIGTFSARRRQPRQGRNPRNGKAVSIPEKVMPHFKTGKKLHDMLNTSFTHHR